MKEPAFFCLFLICSIGLAMADYPLEVIELKTRPAGEVVPLIKPFLGSDEILVGKSYKLFVRAAPERLDEIRNLLAEIDIEPRRLMIHVRRVNPAKLKGNNTGYGANLELGDDTRFALGERSPRRGGSISTQSGRRSSSAWTRSRPDSG